MLAVERRRGWPDEVPRHRRRGLGALRRAGARRRAATWWTTLRREPWVLADALAATPADVPARRLEDGQPRQPPRRAHDPDRLRLPGRGPGLPRPRPGTWRSTGPGCPSPRRPPSTASAPRSSAHGVDTAGWWDRQLGLCLLGAAGAVRLGEGARRRRRAGLVGRPRPGPAPAGCDRRRRATRGDVGARPTTPPATAWAGGRRPGSTTGWPRRWWPRSPVPLAGRLVLDVGAGTGAASRASPRPGGRPPWRSTSRRGCSRADAAGPCRPAVAATPPRCRSAPARSAAVVAAFSLNHLPDPAAGLAEAARVPARVAVLVAAYAADDDHPVKAAVERAAGRGGVGARRPGTSSCGPTVVPRWPPSTGMARGRGEGRARGPASRVDGRAARA